MKKEFLPLSLRIIKKPMNYKVVWDFFRGANVKEKNLYKIRKSVVTSNVFEYKRTPFRVESYNRLEVGKLAGVVICAKSHLHKLSNFSWAHAMRTLRLRVFVGTLLNKNTNGVVQSVLLRCKIAKAFFLVHLNLTSPNILSFFSMKSRAKASKRASLKFKFHENYKRRLLSKKYGSYNKR